MGGVVHDVKAVVHPVHIGQVPSTAGPLDHVDKSQEPSEAGD